MFRIFIVSDIKQFSSLVRRACAGATVTQVLIVVLALHIRALYQIEYFAATCVNA